MMKDFQKWRDSPVLLEATQEMRFRVNHAAYGKIPPFKGTNRLSENRLYFCQENCGRIHWSTDRGDCKELPLRAGTLTLIPGNIDLTYNFTPGRMAGFHFNMEIFPGLDIFHEEADCRQLTDQGDLCHEVLNALNAGTQLSDALRLHSLLFRAASCFCNVDVKELRHQVLLRKKYAGLLAIVETRMDATLTLGELAQTLGQTRDKLSKAFRRDLGLPLKKYLATRLTRKAARLLATGMNVRETAEELGFSSEFYFSRFFSKQTGCTPSDYRREHLIRNTH
jgi:AraC-like DNA-binding protein